jgi:hypothetical protein
LLAHGLREWPVAAEQLYDLVGDPNESCNRVGDPRVPLSADSATAAALAEMRERLARFMRDTADPLLRGPVPAPPGAQVNDPAGLSPRERTKQAGTE